MLKGPLQPATVGAVSESQTPNGDNGRGDIKSLKKCFLA
jgi:hypothetical protein